MKHYGYFGAAAPEHEMEHGGGLPSPGEIAESAQMYREREKESAFGARCPELMDLSAQAVELSNYLYNGYPGLDGKRDTLAYRLGLIVEPIQKVIDETDATLSQLISRRDSYGWILSLFPRKKKALVNAVDRAESSLNSAKGNLNALVDQLKAIEDGVKMNALTSAPWARETVLRWCDNAISHVPMERDVCSDYRTRREMLNGATSTYRKWDISCDRMVQYNRYSLEEGTKFDWPRPLDEEGCLSGSERWEGVSLGCKIPYALRKSPHSVKVKREGCYITEECWDKYDWERRVTNIANRAFAQRGLSDDSTGLLNALWNNLWDATDAVKKSARRTEEAMDEVHSALKNKWVKSAIIGGVSAGTLLLGSVSVTMAYNRGQDRVKASRDDCRRLKNRTTTKLDEAERIFIDKFATAPESSASYTRRMSELPLPCTGWRMINECIADDLMAIAFRMAELTKGLAPTCDYVYPSRTTAQWKALGVPETCMIPISSYAPTGYGPGILPPTGRPKGGGATGIPGAPSGGALEVAGVGMGAYGSVQGQPAKHYGLTKNQWLLVGAVGAAFYFKGKK